MNIRIKIKGSKVLILVFFLTTIHGFVLMEFVWWLQKESLGRLDLN
jgi:hypothetical protein